MYCLDANLLQKQHNSFKINNICIAWMIYTHTHYVKFDEQCDKSSLSKLNHAFCFILLCRQTHVIYNKCAIMVAARSFDRNQIQTPILHIPLHIATHSTHSFYT